MTGEEAALPPVTHPITELTPEMRGLYLVTTLQAARGAEVPQHFQAIGHPHQWDCPGVNSASTRATSSLLTMPDQ
jgi:hypothetical protein